MNDQPNTISMSGYLPNGRRVFVTLSCEDPADAVSRAIELDHMLTSNFITVNLPGLEPGENKEQIVTVMRRAKPADGTPIIDFYPQWGDGGDEPFGTYKYLHVYLNLDKPEMVTDFLAASGFKSLNDIPLYDGQSPLKRTRNRPHPKETAVPTPFFVVKKQGDERVGSDGQPYRPWELVRYEHQVNGNNPTPPSSPPPAPSQNGNHDSGHAPAKNAFTPTSVGAGGQATIVWPSKEALDVLLHRLQGDTGIIDMSNHEFARLCGIESVDDLTAWETYSSGKAAYEAAMKQFEAEEKAATPKSWEYSRDALSLHADVIALYPQKNHRESAIDLLRGSGLFNDVTSMAGAVQQIKTYHGLRNTDELDQAAAIARMKSFAEAF